MIPEPERDHADTREAMLVPEVMSFLGEEDGIRFWRGIDPDVARTEVFLARAHAAPGTVIPAHWHSHDTIAYLTSGRAVFRSGPDLADVHEMKAGDWLFVPAGMVHGEETPADEHGEFLYARDGRGGSTTYVQRDRASG